MNMRLLSTILVCVGTAVACFGLAGCADLKKQLPAPVSPGVQVHDVGWADTTAANFHGKVLKSGQYHLTDCAPCHAQSYAGGTSGVSCFACHTSFPHGQGWSDPSAATFHGRFVAAQQWQTNECKSCHGVAFEGGSSGVTCYACHNSFPHESGWINPGSSGFHGSFIRAAGWDMRSCQTCHGQIYDGGRTNVSCRTCHTGNAGPENCTTCHGSTTANAAPPQDLDGNTARSAEGVGAHQKHLLGSSSFPALACSECHVVPASVYAPGHIDATRKADLHFSSLAQTVTNELSTVDYDANLPLITPNPPDSLTQGTCAGTYCHGNFKNGNINFTPVWTDTTGAQAACGTCHGNITTPLDTLGTRYLPKTASNGGSHPEVAALRIRCNVCHAEVVDANFRIINPSKHINGKLNVLGEERDY